jgi:hypothetical protein
LGTPLTQLCKSGIIYNYENPAEGGIAVEKALE